MKDHGPSASPIPTENAEVAMPMLEKMARAMYPQAFQDTAGEPPVIVRRVAEYRVQAFAKARAALEAIRVPRQELHEVGREAGTIVSGGRIIAVSPDAAFTAMINAILTGEA